MADSAADPVGGDARRRIWTALALVGFGLVLLVPGLGRMGARDSTDARYLAIAREMARHGDWLVPRLGGAPHLDKPPLAYWASALGQAVAGPPEYGGRLLQQGFVLLTAAAVFAAARRLAGREAPGPPGQHAGREAPGPPGQHAGREAPGPLERRDGDAWALPAALVFLTSALPFASSRGLATDHFQLAFVTAALLALLVGARRHAAAPVALAGLLLGASMLAKGPIGLLVVASVWLGFALLARRDARLPGRGVAAGLLLFAAIGLPWYVLLVAREPALRDWFLEVQLAGRVVGGGAGHPNDASYLLGTWLAGLLPWTPLVAVALVRLARRARAGDGIDAFLVAWSLAPVLLFSLFATKLASYVLPAFPAAALALARAGGSGLLDDRTGRRALGASWGLAAAAAGTAALFLLLGARDAAALGLAPARLVAAPAFALAFAGLAALGVAGAWRARRADVARSCTALACLAGTVLACAFHAAAPVLPTLRDAAAWVRRVPGARVVEFSFKPSLFFYVEPAATVYVAGVRDLVAPWVEPASAQRLALPHAAGVALLREDAPTFALVDRVEAEALRAASGSRSVAREGKYVLLANPSAQRALEASASGP